MNDLNNFIDTTRKFTGQVDGIPVPDRSQQISVGLEMAQRMAQQTQQPQPAPPAPMPPIVPVAN